MSAYDFYKKYSLEQLLDLDKSIRANPKNQNSGSLFMFTKSANEKLNKISFAITWKVQEKSKAA